MVDYCDKEIMASVIRKSVVDITILPKSIVQMIPYLYMLPMAMVPGTPTDLS